MFYSFYHTESGQWMHYQSSELPFVQIPQRLDEKKTTAFQEVFIKLPQASQAVGTGPYAKGIAFSKGQMPCIPCVKKGIPLYAVFVIFRVLTMIWDRTIGRSFS